MPSYGTGYRPRSPWGAGAGQSMVARLVLANIVVFIVQSLVPAVTPLFSLVPRFVVERLWVWQIVTYMFLHGSFGHLFWNMLMLWIFGGAIEAAWGPRTFLRYYLFCGIGGALASFVFSYHALTLGASGAIFGLYLAYAMMFPDSTIYLYFLVPVKAKYLITGIALLQLASGLSGPSGIAYFAHLGGMAAGLVFFREHVARMLRHRFGARRRWMAAQRDARRRPPEREATEADNVDSILDKISEKGWENLSATERRILENYSRRYGNRGDGPDA